MSYFEFFRFPKARKRSAAEKNAIASLPIWKFERPVFSPEELAQFDAIFAGAPSCSCPNKCTCPKAMSAAKKRPSAEEVAEAKAVLKSDADASVNALHDQFEYEVAEAEVMMEALEQTEYENAKDVDPDWTRVSYNPEIIDKDKVEQKYTREVAFWGSDVFESKPPKQYVYVLKSMKDEVVAFIRDECTAE